MTAATNEYARRADLRQPEEQIDRIMSNFKSGLLRWLAAMMIIQTTVIIGIFKLLI